MAGKFATYGSDTLSTTEATATIAGVIGAAAVRPRIYDIIMAADGVAPVDYAANIWVARSDGTALGSPGTSPTPVPLDHDDVAAVATSGFNWATTAPSVYDAVPLLNITFNSRATFRWVAAPGSELYVASVANALIGLECQAVSTAFDVEVSILFEE